MKNALLSLLILSLLSPAHVFSAFYQWTDTGGVVHMTDDPDKIPGQYRTKARRIEVQDPPGMPAGTSAPPPAAASDRAASPGPPGQDENWWRGRSSELRAELNALQNSRRQKEELLVQLRRKRTIFQRARDRQAINAVQAELAADEERISEVLNKITALELAAARAGVPAEWLR